MPAMMDDFAEQCAELSQKLTDTLFEAPDAVAICALPGVMAAVAKTFGIPRDTIVAMLDSALADMKDA